MTEPSYNRRLINDEERVIKNMQHQYINIFQRLLLELQVRYDFEYYTGIRRAQGDHHLNQAFDARHAEFHEGDFWLLARNHRREPVATYCLRRFVVDDFYDLIRSLALWFPNRRLPPDPRFVVTCEIPSFGGEVVHGGGLWVRDDYRGASRLAALMPRFARVIALRRRPFDHDSAMIRNDPADRTDTVERKAIYMGRRVYGFARVHRFVAGWFPPEGRAAIMHLCHATRAEAIASLPVFDWKSSGPGSGPPTRSRRCAGGVHSLAAG
jgi:hypothetical protein